MMIFKHTSWQNFFELSSQKISILAVENPTLLWEYCTDLINQSNGDVGNFIVSKNFIEHAFEKFCCVEISLPELKINTKKLQTALIKRCADLCINTEFEKQYREILLSLYDFCKKVCNDTGYSIELDESFGSAGLFKLFSVSFKEIFSSLIEKLIEYVNINIEFLKTKVCIFLFLTKFLTTAELKSFFEHCRYQNLSLILIEEALPSIFDFKDIPCQALIIDRDNCEITKGFDNSL